MTEIYSQVPRRAGKDCFCKLPDEVAPLAEGIHKLVQGVNYEKDLDEMIASANKPKITTNKLNENFAKKEFPNALEDF